MSLDETVDLKNSIVARPTTEMQGKLCSLNGEIVDIKEHMVIQGVHIEASIEKDGLRLAKLELVSNKDEQHREAVLNIENELKHRRLDMEANKKEVQLIKTQLDSTEDEAEEMSLFEEWKEKINHLESFQNN